MAVVNLNDVVFLGLGQAVGPQCPGKRGLFYPGTQEHFLGVDDIVLDKLCRSKLDEAELGRTTSAKHIHVTTDPHVLQASSVTIPTPCSSAPRLRTQVTLRGDRPALLTSSNVCSKIIKERTQAVLCGDRVCPLSYSTDYIEVVSVIFELAVESFTPCLVGLE